MKCKMLFYRFGEIVVFWWEKRKKKKKRSPFFANLARFSHLSINK